MTTTNINAVERLRRQIQSGKVATVGAPSAAENAAEFDDNFLDMGGDADSAGAASALKSAGAFSESAESAESDTGASERLSHATLADPPEQLLQLTRPGVFTRAVAAPPVLPVASFLLETPTPPVAAQPVLTAQERLRKTSAVVNNTAFSTSQARREMATMKTLTRMLEAVFARPGSTASEHARMTALSELAINARELGAAVARVAGDDVERSSYVAAMATDAAVGLVCQSWEDGRTVDWPLLLQACVDNQEIMSTAESMSYAQSLHFSPVDNPEAVTDRLAVSMHAAFWRLIDLGDTVDGMVPKLAAQIVRESTLYLQGREKFVSDTTLHVSWMQSSIGRMNNLICAELRARFGGRGVVPTREEIDAVLAVSRSGFEGVENYAQSILEKSRPISTDRPGH